MRFYFGSENNANVELWSTEFCPIKRECIIIFLADLFHLDIQYQIGYNSTKPQI